MNSNIEQSGKKKNFVKGSGKIPEVISSKDIAQFISGHMEANKDEIQRAQTELPVIKPADGGPDSYMQLKDILVRGYKSPEWDENGHSVSRPVLNSETGILDFGLYSLVSLKKFVVASSRYNRYIDGPMILFREHDRKIILCMPKEDVSIAVKGDGLEGFSIKPDFSHKYLLEYIYLMMRHERFLAQFPEGMNALSLLNGWIPTLAYGKQEEIIKKLRGRTCDELNEGLEILSKQL
jgi:hypothetical protein